MKMSEIKELNHEEINARIIELKRELLNLRFQLATGSLENTAQIKSIKKDIARLNTALNQK